MKEKINRFFKTPPLHTWNIAGFRFGAQVKHEMGKLDPEHQGPQHFKLNHEVLYSNPLLTRAYPSLIFTIAASIPSIAEKLANDTDEGVKANARKRNVHMMHSFSKAIDPNERIAKSEGERLKRLHEVIQTNPDDMQFVLDLMRTTERSMLVKFGRDIDPDAQKSIDSTWLRLGRHMGIEHDERTLEETEQAVREYIEKHGNYTEDGHTVALALIDDFVAAPPHFGSLLAILKRRFFLSMLDANTRKILRLESPGRAAEIATIAINRLHIGTKSMHIVREKPWSDIS